MKPHRCALAFLLVAVFARAELRVETTVTGVPADATELIFVLDTTITTEGPGYEDPNQAPPPPPAATAATPPTDAAPQPPRRRFGRGSAPRPPAPIRGTVTANKNATAVWRVTPSAPGENYRVRVVAVKGDGTFPIVLAGGKATGLKVHADTVTTANVALATPMLKLAAENPTSVAAGAKFALAGVVTDPASFLGTKNRVRAWLSAGAAPVANRSGTQTSTVDVTTTGDEIAFTIELIAPREPGPLWVQFGEVSNDFNRTDGTQVPFLVLPDATTGPVLRLQVARPPNATASLPER